MSDSEHYAISVIMFLLWLRVKHVIELKVFFYLLLLSYLTDLIFVCVFDNLLEHVSWFCLGDPTTFTINVV